MTLKSNRIVPALQFAAQKGLARDQVDEALDQLTALVEAASETKPVRGPCTVLTTIGRKSDGEPLVVAWTTCYGCHAHVSRCDCAKGPTMPPYVTRWVEEFESKHSLSAIKAGMSTTVSSPENGAEGLSPGRGSGSDESTIPPVQRAPKGVPSCKQCGKGVTTEGEFANADRNDDDTYTCFDCQEGGA